MVRDSSDTSAGSALRRSAALVLEISGPGDAERGFGLIERLRDALPIWIFDPESTVATSVRWMKAGAAHVATGLDEIREWLESLRDATPDGPESKSALIGRSLAVRNIEADIRLVANRRCNVLIEGETGTGKEVAGREIHAGGDRSRAPWVAVNCSAIPETLLEAELFGHVRGAFTGAFQARAGKFEAAGHGTIFLDEIGDMPLATQAKLLRVLQEREIERLGGNERIKLDVRVIAATNANLAHRVQEGLFREDLYYRLNVFRIVLPPLRSRTEDIPVLAQHFVDRFCAQERFPRKTFDRFAMDRLQAHPWPGNVRELENTMEAAVIVSGGRTTIFPSDLRFSLAAPLPKPVRSETSVELPPQGMDYQSALEEFEKNLLAQALARARGNKTAAADLLGLKRTTLAAKMKVLGSRVPRLVA
ncbi:MAG: sigma-54 dependent transcriptional regulator [Acidobacteriota bacterium]